ncbi:MAG TPA: BTAD domain-containing putative transcriptional regulator [Symbiobacteriaceae bacterium]|nr:BTAD domain-containing putative transcriptional regulator [Symbiobacteriaceae bacterium]
MKEPLALLTTPAVPCMHTQETVAALLSAHDYGAAVDAIWQVAVRMIQGEENLPVPTLSAWIESCPAPWQDDPRLRYVRSWCFLDQRRITMALLELEKVERDWSARLGGPDDAEARRWLLLVRIAQGVVYESDGRRDKARALFAEAFGEMVDGPCPGTLELDPHEAGRLTALDPVGLTGVTIKALAFFQACGDRAGLARAAHNLGHTYLDIGEPAPARYWLEQALEIKRDLPGEFPLAYTLDSLGRCYQSLGMLNEAQAVLEESLQIAARLGSVSLQASSLACLGDLFRDRDEAESALEVYHRALQLRERQRDRLGMAEIHLAIGTLHRRSGHAGLAADSAAEARTLTTGHGAPPVFRATAAMHEAIALLLLGEPDAGAQLTGALAQVFEFCAPGEAMLGCWYLALDAWRKGQAAEAMAHARRALTLASQCRQLHSLAMELPVTAPVCAVLSSPGASAELLAGLAQRASARGLLALLEAVPEAHGLVAAAGRLPEATALSVQLLGPFRVMRAGRELDLGAARSQKAVSLFKFLVAQRGHAVAREQILDAIWPESDPDSADRSFEVTLSTLRRLLDPPQGVTLIVRRGRGYMLNPDVPVRLDVERFQTHLSRGNWWCQRGQPALALAEWEHAEALYGGDFLADDPYEDWATADRERLREQYLDLLLRLGDLALEAGRPAEAVERAHRVLIADPIRESAYRLLMRAHARQGNRAVALRDLQRCSEVLRRELGEEPMPETRELAHRIRTGEVR